MSLAICTSTSLAVLDPASLSGDLSGVPLSSLATCVSWTADNTGVFVASSTGAICKHGVDGKFVSEVVKASGIPVSAVVVKDRSNLIYAQGNKTVVYNVTTRKPSLILDSPSHQPVTAISLSSDTTLLVVTTASAAQIHNLTMASCTNLSLRSLPPSSPITACEFHPHRRTSLLLGAGNNIVLYDITKPTTPVKSVPLSAKGDIIGIACSPISKTLVAAASRDGSVSLIDLEKDKCLFITLCLRVPLVSLTFQVDGTALILGTENGKILIQDLRALDKPPRATIIDTGGGCILGLCTQKKTAKTSSVVSKAPIKGPGVKQPLAPRDTNPTAPLPSRRSSNDSKPSTGPSPRRKEDTKLNTFSPIRKSVQRKDALNVSVRIESLVGDHKRVPSGRDSSSPKFNIGQKENQKKVSALKLQPRQISTHYVPVREIDRPRSGASSSRPSTSPQLGQDDLKAPSDVERRISMLTVELERTPSPDLPSTAEVSPTSYKNGTGLTQLSNPEPIKNAALAMGTPEVDRWIKAGEPPDDASRGGKRVGWAGAKQPPGLSPGSSEESDNQEDQMTAAPPILYSKSVKTARFTPTRPSSTAMQVSPFRVETSPLRTARSSGQSPLNGHTSTGIGGGAQDFLRAVVKDVMYDFHAEQQDELRGLHVDLIKMARSFKKTELRTLMEEYVGDLKDLRDENATLRKENERLRRGY